MAFGDAGIELLLAVEGLLCSLRHWLWLFTALRMPYKLKVRVMAVQANA